MPLSISPRRYWWEFNGTDAALRLLGTDSDAVLFDPSSQNDDFTVVACLKLDTEPSAGESYGIMCKWDEGGSTRSWALTISGDMADLEARVSKDGTAAGGSVSSVDISEAFPSLDKKNIVSMRYKFVADGTSELIVDCEDQSDSISDAVGPVFSTTGADVQLADYDASGFDAFFNGKVYWFAYWNRKLDDSEIQDLKSGTIKPQQIDPDFYWDGHRAVASTYDSDIPSLSPVSFTVEGTPLAGGWGPENPLYAPYRPWASRYWDFNGSTDALRLVGTDPNAAIFDPQSNTNDFTVAGLIMPDDTAGDEGIMAKRNASNASWWLFKSSSALKLRVSQTGSPSVFTEASISQLESAALRRFVGRYEYSGSPGASSYLSLDMADWYGNTRWKHETAVAVGPVHSSTSLDVQISDFDDAANRWYSGRVYWLAYWNRKLDDVETTLLDEGAIDPKDLNPDYYEEFGDTVGATNSSEIPDSPSIDFDVEGSPIMVESITSEESIDEEISNALVWPVKEIDPVVDSMTGSWWYCDETPTYEYLHLTNANGAGDFVRGEFTALVLLDRTGTTTKAAFYKHASTVWMIQVVGNGYLRGFVNNFNNSVENGAPPGELNLVALAYKNVGGSNDLFKIVGVSSTYGLLSDLNVGSYGGLTDYGDPLGICQNGPASSVLIGSYYMAAFLDTYLSDSEILEIWNGRHPSEFSGFRFLVDFHQQPISTYVSDDHNQYVLDVFGSPTWGGTGNPTVGAARSRILMPALHTVRDQTRQGVHPRSTAQHKGVVKHQPGDTQRKDDGSILLPGDVGYLASLHAIKDATRQGIHPRTTAQDKGVVSVAKYKRKKA